MIRQRTSPLVAVIVTGVDIVTIDVDVSEEDTRLQEPSLGRLREWMQWEGHGLTASHLHALPLPPKAIWLSKVC